MTDPEFAVWRERLAQEARTARRAVEREGAYPSRWREAAHLRKSGYLRSPVVREALRADEEAAANCKPKEIALMWGEASVMGNVSSRPNAMEVESPSQEGIESISWPQ